MSLSASRVPEDEAVVPFVRFAKRVHNRVGEVTPLEMETHRSVGGRGWVNYPTLGSVQFNNCTTHSINCAGS